MAAPHLHQQRAAPMNASPHHPKVKTTLSFSDPLYVAGGAITGKMELESKTDKSLGLSVIMIELVALEELTSRDHSASSTFLHTRRLYQGPGVPPSNAVHPYPLAGEPPLPTGYHPARKGVTSFLFKLPIPLESPSSIDFGKGLARVKYEVRTTVGVCWRGERRLVADAKEVNVVERFDDINYDRVEPHGVVVGEQGKVWMQGRVVGGLVVAGESACVELQVKNHSAKKTSGLSVTLTRHLHFPSPEPPNAPTLEITDTLTTVNFRGPEYTALPGTEGVAQLVFDVPNDARTVHGGSRKGSDEEVLPKDPLFEVRCTVSIKLSMPIGSKDILLNLPVTIFHPIALPSPDLSPEPYTVLPYASLLHPPVPLAYSDRAGSPYAYAPHPMTPPLLHSISPQPYYHIPGQLWSPPPPVHSYSAYYPAQVPPGQAYYFPPPLEPPPGVLPRPLSTEPIASEPLHSLPSGLPTTTNTTHPIFTFSRDDTLAQGERAEGKGERASRFTQHLRMSSRHRSASPPSHRFALPELQASVQDRQISIYGPPSPGAALATNEQPSPLLGTPEVLATIAAPQLSSSARNPQRLSLGTLPPVEVASPRPMPSPKMAVSADPLSHASLNKTERVALLEALAAHEADADLSAGLSEPPADASSPPRVDKTLPGPPVPSTKPAHLLTRSALGALFTEPELELESELEALYVPEPKTPTLTALSLLKPPRVSGLDALERRLAAEVGTRKIEAPRRPDVRTVLGALDIPPSGTPGDDTVNDSAISSLSLGAEDFREHVKAHELEREREWHERERAEREKMQDEDEVEHDSEGRTHKGRGSHSSGSERRTARRSNGANLKEKKRGPKRRDEEAVRLRRAAKGRVAAWLERCAPGAECEPDDLQDDESPVTSGPIPDAIRRQESAQTVAAKEVLSGTDAVGTVRSRTSSEAKTKRWLSAIATGPKASERDSDSGSTAASKPPLEHHPIADFPAKTDNASSKNLSATRPPTSRKSSSEDLRKTPRLAASQKPNPRSDSAAQSPVVVSEQSHKDGANDTVRAPNPRSSGFISMSTLRAGRKAAGPEDTPVAGPRQTNVRASPRTRWEAALYNPPPSAEKGERLPFPRKLLSAGQRTPAYQPQEISSAAKYDVRSARGGRGGKVTAVTAIWANIGSDTPSSRKPLPLPAKAKPSKPQPLLKGARARATPTSASPAAVSSSHARPTLSSTASLARPTTEVRSARVPPLVAEEPAIAAASVAKAAATTSQGSKPVSKGELAFGQARLRDLIRKYQTQET